MINQVLLYPVLALVGWTFVMWVWLYATRIPAIQKAQIDFEELAKTGAPLVLPASVSRVADNYNHLHEQPTIFYALTLSAAMFGVTDGFALGLAWLYVGIRVIHSFIQAVSNPIFVRFIVFCIGSLVLFLLLLRTVFLVI